MSRAGFAAKIPVCPLALAGLLLAGLPGVCRAEDTDQDRLYGSFRFGVNTHLHLKAAPGVEVDRIQQSYGFSLGVNLGRYFGLEIAADQSATDLTVPGRGTIGEYGIFNLVPEVRVRYPLLGGTLTPYVIGGVGASQAQFKDRKPPGGGLSIHASDWSVVGSIGAGVEYFLANNVALGLEAKYLISRGHEIQINGTRNTANLDSLIAGASLRLLFPESPSVQAEPPIYGTDGRFYVGVRYGGSVTTHKNIAAGVEYEPSQDAIGGAMDQLIAVNVGTDFSRHLGIELSGGGFSPILRLPGIGDVAEYAVYYVIPQVRVRYPVLGGRLVPYLIGGVGATHFEIKDVKPRGFNLQLSASNLGVAGAFGGGVEYLVARNIGVGFEVEYLLSRGNSATIGGRTQHVNLDALLMTGGLRVYFGRGTSGQ